MRFRTLSLAATCLVLPAIVQAQPITGLYIAGGGGANFLNNEKLNGLTTPSTHGEGFLDSKLGYVGLGSIGYGLGNGLRFEVEGDYRYNQLKKVTGIVPAPGLTAGGHQQDVAAMFNAMYDFNLSLLGVDWMSPYAGVGVGADWSNLKSGRFYTLSGASQSYAFNGQANSSFAYQIILGSSFPIPGVAGLALTAEYRFFGLPNDRVFKGSAAFAPGALSRTSLASTTSATAKFTGSESQSFLIGLRYAFNTAPPPPPPAPIAVPTPPAAARTYLVFFDWDRADLTSRARQIIKEAALASTKTQLTKIQVNGYTDLSGTAAYNQRLSVRRAEAVAKELVADGVPRAVISMEGFGETNPLVPTAKGVREPQNRRVEIILK
jgi:outer membrane protein OmpA-like peptidoglycan-associated protein